MLYEKLRAAKFTLLIQSAARNAFLQRLSGVGSYLSKVAFQAAPVLQS